MNTTIKDHDSLSRFIAEGFRRDSPRRCSFPVEAARRMGASDGQILGYLARRSSFDVAAACQAGYSNDEIIRYLSSGDEIPIDDSESAGTSGASGGTCHSLVEAGQEAASTEGLNQCLTETARERALSRTPTSPEEPTSMSENVPANVVMPQERRTNMNESRGINSSIAAESGVGRTLAPSAMATPAAPGPKARKIPAPTKSDGSPGMPQPDVRMIARVIGLLLEPGSVAELRAPETRSGYGRPATVSGYFSDHDLLAKEALKLSGRAPGIYITLNCVCPDLLARSENKVTSYPKYTTTDKDILRRLWLLLDFDPVKAAGISAAEEEHNAALRRAEDCRQWLAGQGWPAPIAADSGNGGHLVYRIDLPNDEDATQLMKRVLEVLSQRFSDDKVKLDTSTYNAARISKLYGTLAAKGSSTLERPHRLAQLVSVPPELSVVSRELLEALAGEVSRPQPKSARSLLPPRHTNPAIPASSRIDVEAWCRNHDIAVEKDAPYTDGHKWILKVCPFNPEHDRGEACLIQFSSGIVIFRCQHASCKDKNWEMLRAAFIDPDPGRQVHDWGGGQFELSERGVEYTPAPDKDGNAKPATWLCSELEILAQTRDHQSSAWGLLLEWHDKDGEVHRRALPVELLRRDSGAEALCLLASEGLTISAAKAVKELLPTYLQVWPADRRARCVDRPGWASAAGRMVYVLDTEAIGEADELIVYQNIHNVTPAFSQQGTAEEWKSEIATPAQGNSRLMFAISCAFAGPLLELAGEQPGGFHLRGPSSSGKSTALELAASVWGHPEKYRRTWRATTSGLEGVATIHNDGLLILDELAQVDAREAGEASYMLANGTGKSRAARNGMARATATWRLLFLSAGEQSLAQHMANVGRKPTVGQELRMAEIDADAGAGMGILEKLHSFKSALDMIEALRERSRKYHGAVGRRFLEKLVSDRAGRTGDDAPRVGVTLAAGIRKFVTDHTVPQAGAQVERAARRFALGGLAGELVTTYGLTGWPEGAALTAAAACFVSWKNIFGPSGDREDRQLLEQARAFFELHGSSRFQDLASESDQQISKQAGFYRYWGDKNNQGPREYLVYKSAFCDEICKGHDQRTAAKVLRKHGWLLPDKEGKSAQSIYVPSLGGTTRLYVFGSRIWEGDN